MKGDVFCGARQVPAALDPAALLSSEKVDDRIPTGCACCRELQLQRWRVCLCAGGLGWASKGVSVRGCLGAWGRAPHPVPKGWPHGPLRTEHPRMGGETPVCLFLCPTQGLVMRER